MISNVVVDDLMVVSVDGEVTTEEILEAISDYLASHGSLKALWDFSGAEKVKVTTADLRRITDDLKSHFKHNAGRKVALAGSGNINIGLGRLFTVFAAVAGLPSEYRVFRKVEHAMRWLKE
jgi:hypothetical protein